MCVWRGIGVRVGFLSCGRATGGKHVQELKLIAIAGWEDPKALHSLLIFPVAHFPQSSVSLQARSTYQMLGFLPAWIVSPLHVYPQ